MARRPPWYEPKKPKRVKRREQAIKKRRALGDIEIRRSHTKKPKGDEPE